MSKIVRKHALNAVAFWSEDGTTGILNVTLRSAPGVRVVGNGTLQAPLSAEIDPAVIAALRAIAFEATPAIDHPALARQALAVLGYPGPTPLLDEIVASVTDMGRAA